jgi:release factor glutamine methyltransferase
LLAQESDSPKLDCEILLAHCLGKPRAYLYARPELEVDSQTSARFDELLSRRQRGEPVAYLVGRQEFWSLELEVSPATLIPRPETELLVELALEFFPGENLRVLDLGTGTGAIALALASERPGWQLTGVDNNADAVKLAIRNAERLAIRNVRFTESDWYEALSGQRFNLILANPPYIDPADSHLQQGDLRYEPREALVAEENGLADLRPIINRAPNYLYDGGCLMVEHGLDQGEPVREIFKQGDWHAVETCRDLGDRDRVTGAFYR